MDPATISVLADIVSKSGPVVLFAAIWVAFKAGQTAKEAVDALKDIRDDVKGHGPLMKEIVEDLEPIARRVTAIDERTATLDMKVSALVSRRS